MLPADQLEVTVSRDRIVPRFFTQADHPWLRGLLDVYEASVGLPRRALRGRLAGRPAQGASAASRARACRELDRLFGGEVSSPVPPPALRAALFAEAANAPRALSLARCGEALGLPAEVIERHLFADLPSERLVRAPDAPIAPVDLAALANASLASSLVARARRVTVRAFGSARDVVRYARLRGLLCTVADLAAHDAYELEISGPYSLFRHTTVYGRALASLVPRLAWCERFEVDADVRIGDRVGALRLQTGDPITPSVPPRRFDSKLEERFARDFARATSDYRLVREPAPLRAGDSLVLPDFAVVRAGGDEPVAWLEIVGFWTEGYLERKLAQLAHVGDARFIVCVDAERACGEGTIPERARVVQFRRRVDARAVLAAVVDVERANAGSRSSGTLARP